MRLTILSEAPVPMEDEPLAVTLDGCTSRIPARVALRSGACVAYGSFDLAPGFGGTVAALKHLFVLVTSGVLEIEADGARLIASAGEAFVLPQGAQAKWASPQGASAVFSSCADAAAPEASGFVSLPLDTPREVSPPYPKEMLLAGDPEQSGKRLFSDSRGCWGVGIWDSGPYHRRPIAFPKNELMYLHCGSASFTRPDGAVLRQDRNAPFVVKKGFEADWNSQVYVFKTYCADTF